MFLNDVLEEFILDCKIRKLTNPTIVSYRNSNLALFRYLKSEYEITELKDVNRAHMKAYVDYLSGRGLKESYVNAQIRNFRAFFKYCEEESYISDNPMTKVKWQKEEMPLIETFTDVEVVKMVNYYHGSKYMDVRNRLIIAMLFDTGLRCHELCNLTVSDVRDTYLHILGKGKKVRHVPISDVLKRHMMKYERVRKDYVKDKVTTDYEYYFLSQKGKKLTEPTILRIMHIAGKETGVRAEIRCSPHTARHYYAQKMLRNGVDLYTVSKLLGHNNLQITKRYLQSMDEDSFFKMTSDTSPLSTLAGQTKVSRKNKGGGSK